MSTPSSTRRALAVVRCGEKSLHRNWVQGAKMFDIAVSYYGDDAERTFPEARYVHRKKGGKWDGLFDFFRANPDAAASYDYYWFPDDDIDCTAADIDRLVSLGAEHGLDLFQPALDSRSYFSHLVTLGNSSFRLRYTNFVEIMAPVLSRRLLQCVLPSLQTTRSGFGLDFVWPRMAVALSGDPIRAAAIVDAVRVRHTRPVGGDLHKMMKKTGGATSSDEMIEALKNVDAPARSRINGVPTPRVRVLAAIDHAGRFVPGWRAASSIAFDLIFRDRNIVQAINPGGAVKHALKSLFV